MDGSAEIRKGNTRTRFDFIARTSPKCFHGSADCWAVSCRSSVAPTRNIGDHPECIPIWSFYVILFILLYLVLSRSKFLAQTRICFQLNYTNSATIILN